LEEALKKSEAENKILDKKNNDKEILIAEMKEQTKQLEMKQRVFKKQWQEVEAKTNALATEKKKLLIERKYLIDEKDRLTQSIKHAENKTNMTAEQLRDSRNTIKEMGLWWLMRILCPRHLAIDCWFLVFCFAYVYYKTR